ncbi:MAG: ATP-binding cassette domain-containing protein [Spirochaetaceae bacterium]|nr:ATP-binding cassette domain-containing protein [Spirochaetaceae bacterium]
MLNVDKVEKTYETVRAVDGLSFEARPGEIFGLIGPNGAGKSTTIRMIMNVIAPDSGTIRFDGKAFSEDMKARIGYLPEERGLYKKVKVEDMLLYLAALKGVDRVTARASASRWLERFDLAEWKGRKVEELSKGMAQKVQFIGSVVHDPDLVLFDEPFSGLDPVSQDLLLDAVLDLKRRGKTVLFSTHVMEHAEKLCDRLLLVRKGRELIAGPLAEVKARYGRNAVQVEFDGDASFVEALPCVESVRAFPRWLEVALRGDSRPDELFAALAGRLGVRRFQVMEPSLHSIFVRLVGGDSPEAAEADASGSVPGQGEARRA